jgi:hypothetical protein
VVRREVKVVFPVDGWPVIIRDGMGDGGWWRAIYVKG